MSGRMGAEPTVPTRRWMGLRALLTGALLATTVVVSGPVTPVSAVAEGVTLDAITVSPATTPESWLPAGTEFTYTVSYSCSGIILPDCASASISVPLPTFVDIYDDNLHELEFVGASTIFPNDWVLVGVVGNAVVWNAAPAVACNVPLGDPNNGLCTGDTGSLNFVLRVPAGLVPVTQDPQMVIVTATASSPDQDDSPVGPAQSYINAAGALTELSKSGPSSVLLNSAGTDSVTYTINVCPAAGKALHPAYTVTDTLPVGFVVDSLPTPPTVFSQTPGTPSTEDPPPLSTLHEGTGDVLVWEIDEANLPPRNPATGCLQITVVGHFPNRYAGGDLSNVILATKTNSVSAVGHPAGGGDVGIGTATTALTLTGPVTRFSPVKNTDGNYYVDDASPDNVVTYFLGAHNGSDAQATPFSTATLTDEFPAGFTLTEIRTGTWAGTVTASIWTSTDGGATWSQVSSAQNATIVTAPGVTHVKWVFTSPPGAPEIGPGWDASGQQLIGTVSGAPTQTLTNCAALTGVQAEVEQNRGKACANVRLEGPQPHPSVTKSAPGTLEPGDTITYSIEVENNSDATAVLENPQIIDCVPFSSHLVVDNIRADGALLDANDWSLEELSTSPAGGCTPTSPNTPGSGTLIRLQYTGILNPGQSAPTITYDVTADGFLFPTEDDTPTPPGHYTNTVKVTEEGGTDFGHCVQVGCSTSHTTTVPVGAQLQSEKLVMGALDREFNKAGTTTPGGQVTWKLRVQNVGNVPVYNTQIVDIFSFVGDRGVRVSTLRGSEYAPYLVSPITAGLGWTVEYSTATNPCRPEVLGPNSSCTAPNWTSSPNLAALSTYKSIRLTYSGRLGIGEVLDFTYDQVTPVFDPTYDDDPDFPTEGPYDALDNCSIPNSQHPWDPVDLVNFPGDSTLDTSRGQEDAWVDTNADGIQGSDEGGPTCPRASNSFAYGVSLDDNDLGGLLNPGRLGAEPRKVDLHVAAPSRLNVIGNRVWEDYDNDGIQENGEVGIANVRVELYDGQNLIDTTFTDANGWYLFEDLPDSTGYFVRFYMPDNRGYVSPRDQSGSDTDQGASNTDNDSDIPRTPSGSNGIGNYYDTTTITLGNNPGSLSENDPTWDAGIWIPHPAIDVKKKVNGLDADTPTGPQIPRGDTVTWTYVLTNTGNSYLKTVTLTDHVNIPSSGQPDPTPQCDWPLSTNPDTDAGVLAIGEKVTCTATGTAIRDQYKNTANVTGVPALNDGTTTIHKEGVPPFVSDTDPAHYFGVEYDLALAKVATPASVQQDGTVTWTVRVINQGNVNSGAFSVTDVIPAGMSFESAAPVPSANPATRTYRWDVAAVDELAPNEYIDIVIVTRVTDMRMRPFRNWAEISSDSAQPLYGTHDFDSTPDTNVGNDDGAGTGSGPSANPNDPFVDITSLANIPDDQRPTDEDDNDLAEVTGDLVYDLALAKITDAPTATAGDNITWRVRVYNQGNVRSGIAQVTDKLPTGLTYLSGTVYTSANAPLVNSSCAVAVDGFIVTCEIANIGAGDYITIVIVTDITNDNLSTAPWRNWAEISADSAQALYDVDDQDSTPDTDTGRNNTIPNDAYVGIDTIEPMYAGGPGNNDRQVDQDDNDDAVVTNSGEYDLALIKTASPTPIAYDGSVTFTITVRNQGNLPSGDYQVTDNVPLGLTPVLPIPGATWSSLNHTITWNVTLSLAASTETTFTYSATISDIKLRPFRNIAEISDDSSELYGLSDIDSTPDTLTTNDGVYPAVGAEAGSGIDNLLIGEAGNDNNDPQDDADIADVNVNVTYDLALVKVVDATSLANNGLYNGTATFTVTVQNQGSVPSNDFVVTDWVPEGLTPVQPIPNSGVWNSGTITWTIANLAPNATTELSYQVHVTDFTKRPYRNVAEISEDSAVDYGVLDVDSTPDTNIANDGNYPAVSADPGTGIDNMNVGEAGIDNGDPQDDADIADLSFPLTYDLALIKVNDGPAVVQYNGTIQFTITVQNQGTVNSNDFTVFDTLPAGLSVLSAGGGTVSGNAVDGYTLTWTISNLAPGASTTRTVTMTIADIKKRPFRNIAEISIDSADDYDAPLIDVFDIDSTPDQVTTNDGPYPPLLDVPVPGAASDNLFISEAGEETDDQPNPTQLDGQDDADIADVGVQVVYDLALAKLASATTIQPDGSVVFTITVANQGTVPSGNFTVTDTLPVGMHATAASNSGNLATPGFVTWSLTGLNPGQSLSVTLTAVIDDIKKRPYKNIAEISTDSAGTYSTVSVTVTDADSAPDSITTNDSRESGTGPDGYGTYEHPTNDVTNTSGAEGPGAGGQDDADVAFVNVQVIYDLALVKTGPVEFDGSAPATFTITVKNQGNVASGAFTVQDGVPAGLTATAAGSGGVISGGGSLVTWALASLAPGATVALTVNAEITDFAKRPWVNVAEITTDGADLYDSTGYESAPNGNVEDADSVPDTNLANDVLVDQTQLPASQLNDRSIDEDDHDVAPINVNIDYDLSLVKSLVDGQSYKKGNDIVFHVLVMNQGNVNSGPITVIDHLPAGLTFVSADQGGLAAAGVVSWKLEDLAPGEIVTLTVTAKMTDTTKTSYINVAEIGGDGADVYDQYVNQVLVDDVEDDDSVPDADPGNDAIAETDDVAADNVPGDEDDEDIAALDMSKVASDNPVPPALPVPEASAILPASGSDPTPITSWALLLLSAGAFVTVFTRRRRARRA